jgi:Zn-dependent protease
MLWYYDAFADNPDALVVYFLATSVAILTGLVFHEFCHAWAAFQLGDDLAARQGRLTLNPLAHLDPLGTLMILILGFGWAKPTPFNPWRLRPGPDRGGAIVAFAGPASNFVVAVLAALPLRFGLVESSYGANIEAVIRFGGTEDYVFLLLFFVLWINIILGLFNLVPVHPLDGFKVVAGLLPASVAEPFKKLAPWGPGILMLLIVMPWLTNGRVDPLGDFIIGPLGTDLLRTLVLRASASGFASFARRTSRPPMTIICSPASGSMTRSTTCSAASTRATCCTAPGRPAGSSNGAIVVPT